MLDDATTHVQNVVKGMRQSPYLKEQEAESAATNYDKG